MTFADDIKKYFSPAELMCKCGHCDSSGLEMNNDFMQKIFIIREELGWPFIVSSAYRCPEYNDRISKSGLYGPHTTGNAIDILCFHKRAFDLIKLAPYHDITGIGIYQKGAHISRFIHLDDLEAENNRPRPTIWSY